MKSNHGMGYIKVVILIVIIAIFVACGVYFIRLKYNEAKVQTTKTNLLLVQSKIKEYEGRQKISGQEMVYIGTKVSDMQNDLDIFTVLEKGIIPKEDYDKYYVLKDSDLETLTLSISNENRSYYIVNYETYEVIISSGCTYSKDKVLYKLSEIEAEE